MSVKDEFKKFSSKGPRLSEFKEGYEYKKDCLREKWIPHYQLPEHLYKYQELFDASLHAVWTARRCFKKLIDITNYLDDQFGNMVETMDDICDVLVSEIQNLEEYEKRKEKLQQMQNNKDKDKDIDVGKIIDDVNNRMEKIKELEGQFETITKEFNKK